MTALAPATVLCSAFLLFVAQPILGRFVVPWFGGGAAVWTTCLLVFQALLLAGYAWANLLVRRLSPPVAVRLHGMLLLAAALTLPLEPDAASRPDDSSDPVLRIVLLLVRSAGLPLAALGATLPLIQSWHSGLSGTKSWRLYAWSNAGSLLGLLSFPFALEPFFSRRDLASAWDVGFGALAILCLASGLAATRGVPTSVPASDAASAIDRPALKTRLAWIGLPALGAVLLFAATNELGHALAPVPLLWIVPLAAYLISFIVTFDRVGSYRRTAWAFAFALFGSAAIALRYYPGRLDIFETVAVWTGAVLCGCTLCHGETAARRPTSGPVAPFYLHVAAGGAFGGLLVAAIAPLVLRTDMELPLSIAVCAVVAGLAVGGGVADGVASRLARAISIIVAATAVAAAILSEAAAIGSEDSSRGFYGRLRVIERSAFDPSQSRLEFRHNGTLHGIQYLAPDRRRETPGYYGPGTGAARAFEAVARPGSRRIGVVGLGAGAVAALARAGDVVTFYEIDPEVERIAHERFTFLEDSSATTTVVIGDARATLEREPSRGFDLLILDAFSTGAVPLHLLTTEAFAVYARHLAPSGVIAAHVSSFHLDLAAMAAAQANRIGFEKCRVEVAPDGSSDLLPATWVIMARPGVLPRDPSFRAACVPESGDGPEPWTDDRSSVLSALR